MRQAILVSGLLYEWSVIEQTAEFPALALPLIEHQHINILRVTRPQSGFDIAIRINLNAYHGGSTKVSLGPLLVLGNGFPSSEHPVQQGARIGLRPKVSMVAGQFVAEPDVQKVLQWCLSSRFKPTNVNTYGSFQPERA